MIFLPIDALLTRKNSSLAYLQVKELKEEEMK